MPSSWLVVLSAQLVALAALCDAMRFTLPADTVRCFKEEIRKDTLVTGEYELSEAAGIRTDLMVKDSKGHTLFWKEDALAGKFAFTTEENDMFQICIGNKRIDKDGSFQREVFLDIKRGVEAKSYDEIQDAEKLKPLEVELKRLEDMAVAIMSDFLYMKAREEEMQSTNESTHERLTYLSVFSIFCVLALATWQTRYLHHYFKSKRLID